jgi:hypothetical protein
MKSLSIFANSALVMSWLAMSVKLGGNLILISIIVYYYDANDLLFWFNISFLIVFQGMFDAGFGSTFSRFVSYLHGKKNSKKYKNQNLGELVDLRNLFEKKKLDFFVVLAIMKKIYLYLFFITFTLLITLGSYFFSNIINQTSDPYFYWHLWFFYCLSFSIYIYGGMYTSILIGLNKIHIFKRYESYILFLTILIQSILVFYGYSLLLIILILSLSQLINVYINFMILNNHISFKITKKVIVSKKNFYYLLKVCIKAGIGTFFYCLANQFFVLYISNIFPVKESTGMLTLFRIAKVIENYSQTITNVQLPNLTKIFYLNYHLKYFDVSKIITIKSILLMVICFISISIIYPFLILTLENKMIIPSLKYWIFLGLSLSVAFNNIIPR